MLWQSDRAPILCFDRRRFTSWVIRSWTRWTTMPRHLDRAFILFFMILAGTFHGPFVNGTGGRQSRGNQTKPPPLFLFIVAGTFHEPFMNGTGGLICRAQCRQTRPPNFLFWNVADYPMEDPDLFSNPREMHGHGTGAWRRSLTRTLTLTPTLTLTIVAGALHGPFAHGGCGRQCGARRRAEPADRGLCT